MGVLDNLFGGGGASQDIGHNIPSAKQFLLQLRGPQARNILSTSMDTLQSILEGRGRTDPTRFNLQRANILRGTQAQQEQFGAELARRNLQNSGLGLAIQQAIGGAGENRLAQLGAQETAIAEQRMRDDLGLLLELLIGPSMQMALGRAGLAIPAAQMRQQGAGNLLNLLGTALGGFGSLFGK